MNNIYRRIIGWGLFGVAYGLLLLYLYSRPEVGLPLSLRTTDPSNPGMGCAAKGSPPDAETLKQQLRKVHQQMWHQAEKRVSSK